MKDGRKRYLASATDPHGGKPERKRFETRSEAKDWAETRRAELLLGKKVMRRVLPAQALKTEYLAHLKARGLSPRYVEHQDHYVSRLIEVVPNFSDPRAAIQVAQWWAGIASSDLAPASKNMALRSVRAFINWDLKRKPSDRTIRDPDILTGLTPVKGGDRPKPQFTVDELRRMVAAVDDRYWPRFCARIYLGLRNEGAESTPWTNVDLASRVVEVTEKGRKTRLVRIPEELAYLMTSPLWPRSATIAGPRWTQKGGGSAEWRANDPREANRTQQGKDFTQFLKRLGIEKRGRSPHSLRHSYTGIMAATGVSQHVLAHWLGHSDSSATVGYAREAARYVHAVEGWPRGEFRLLEGLTCPFG